MELDTKRVPDRRVDTVYRVGSGVIFGFVVGLTLMTDGMYGRFTGGLAEGNPFREHRARGPRWHGVPVPWGRG
jgi:hypothetical protein